jgi:hypothetical protein
VQPCEPVAVQYGGTPQSAEALRLSSPQAPLCFTRPSLTAQRIPSSLRTALTRALGRRRTGQRRSRHPTWGTPYRNLQLLRILVGGRRASLAPLLRRIAIAARVWRRETIVIISPCLSTVPTLHHADVVVDCCALLIVCHCVRRVGEQCDLPPE